jgi:succinoglycan biosynthesis protein ExoA
MGEDSSANIHCTRFRTGVRAFDSPVAAGNGHAASTTDTLPFVSVVMPVRNEARFIRASLHALLGQDYPRMKMEVIVADGRSTDQTAQIVRELATKDPRVRLIDSRGAISAGLNAAIQCASGGFIARVDGHCVVSPSYLRRSIEVLEATGADAAGGLQTPMGSTLTGRAIALATSFPFGTGNAHFRYRRTACWTDTVYLGVYRRESLGRAGSFDDELERNEDDELNLRLLRAGGRIRLDPSIASVYFCRSDFRSLWTQYYGYGLYKVRVIQKLGAISSFRHLVPALFTVAVLGSLLAAALSLEPVLLLPILGTYSVANLASSLWVSRSGPAALLRVPLAFLVLHVAYGVGFLNGLWRFRAGFRR